MLLTNVLKPLQFKKPFDDFTRGFILFVELGWVAELLAVQTTQLDCALTQPEVEVGGESVKKNQNMGKV